MSQPATSGQFGSSSSNSSVTLHTESPSDAYFATLASSLEKTSPLEERDESPLPVFDSTRGEAAPGALRVPRGSVIPRALDPVIRSTMRPAPAKTSVRSYGTLSGSTSSATPEKASPSTRKSGAARRSDGEGDSESDLLFGSSSTKTAPASPQNASSVRDSINRINAIAERPISPGNRKVEGARTRNSTIFRTRGSLSSETTPVHADSSSTVQDASIASPTSFSPLWRLSKSMPKGSRPQAAPKSPVTRFQGSGSSSSLRMSDANQSPGSIGSTSGMLGDVDTPPGSVIEMAASLQPGVKPGTNIRVKVITKTGKSPRSAGLSGSEDENGLHGSCSDGEEISEIEVSSMFMTDYRPPIVPVNHGPNLSRRSYDPIVTTVEPNRESISDSTSSFADRRILSPLSETIGVEHFQPYYMDTKVTSTSPPLEKRIVAIAPHPGQVPPVTRPVDYFEHLPTRLELRQEKGSSRVDRSDWVRKVLNRNPDLSNLRDRVQPLNRAISFCELYNRGRGKLSVPPELVLQLVMQYFDHEGLRGPLKLLEKESNTHFQFRNLDEFQLLDSRLITLVMIAMNDIENIWDIAMGEKASSRLMSTPGEGEQTSLSNSSNSPRTPKREGDSTLEYDETTIGLTQDPETMAKNMEMLDEILASLRLREQDQAIGLANLNAEIDNDVNIWEDPNDDELIVEPDTGQIVAGSLNRLVELLAPEEEVDLNYVRAFLLTYQLFTTSSALLSKLSQRYNAPRDPAIPEEEWRKRVLPIQIRVVNVIKMWIEEFYSDFDDATVANIRDFFNFQVRELHPTLAVTSLTLLDKFCSRDDRGSALAGTGSAPRVVQFSFSADPPRPIVPKNIFSPNLKWDDVDEEELARQLTLIEFEYFYKIRASEFLHQSWSKTKYKHRAPRILSLIRRFNVVSDWVTTQIVLASKIRQRVQILTKLIGVADHLRKLQNYNTLMSFIAVFNSSSVHRLKHTFAELPAKSQETLAELKRLMKPDDSYMNYRTELEACIPPCVPYLGLYLTELTHAEDGADNEVHGLINFSKCRLVHSIIAHINSHQQKGYNIQAVYQIQQFLRDPQPRIGDKAAHSHSTLIEPRGADRSQIL